ncbi:MAG: hypothetical protein Q4D32_00995 [Eubacteriales bacterium]|nr:hypothetical protein [Eubacteriales bacterium]
MPGTKIIILRMREVIYTAIFVGLGILLLIILFFMFWPGKDSGAQDAAVKSQEKQYQAGVYTKELQMGDATVNLQVTLDEDHVKSVEIVPLDESITTMYPLVEPAVKTISEQLQAGTEVDEISLSDESQYTEQIVLNAVQEIIQEKKN